MACLSIKDLSGVNKFLGLRIKLDESKGYILDQQVTIDLLLKDLKSFQSMVGSLLWIARCTRPDICFAVHKTTRQTHKPTVKDWKTAERIMRYLKMSKDLKLHLSGDGSASKDMRIESWSDADFAVDKSDRKSVSGCVPTMDGSVVFCSCKKQSGVSLSTMEAEFIAASCGGVGSQNCMMRPQTTHCAGLPTVIGGTPMPRMNLLSPCVPVGWRVALFGGLG
ncbi:unnamed protein product [Peronospora effusa]|nr:unnamed protein product [Peronospora effusa]